MKRTFSILCLASLAFSADLQLKSNDTPVYPPLARSARIRGDVILEYTVSAEWAATDIEVITGHPLLAAAVKANLASWQFVPSAEPPPANRQRVTYAFEFLRGYSISASDEIHFEGVTRVRIASTQGPPVTTKGCPAGPIAVPTESAPVHDSVTLTRTICFGTCPAYEVTIHGDGQVVWKGQQFVKATGEHRYQIPPQAAETLLSKFRTSEVWSLCESYSRSITDNPSTVVDIEIGGGRKHILDYAASSPPWFQLLQGEIDAIGLTHDRRHGDAATEPQGNIREEYLPKPGMTPLMESAARGEIQTVRKLIAEGADLNAADSSGWTALMYAAGAYSAAEAIDALLKAGADASLRDRQGRQAFQFVTEPARSEIEMKWSRRTLESAVKQKR